MTTPTYNTRTLAACAKRLRWIYAQSTGMRTTAPDWTIVWRFQEGFRLQVAGEQHERDGWIVYSNLYNGASPAEIERDLNLERVDEIAIESLDLTLHHQPGDLNDDQLRMLVTADDYPETSKLALGRLYERTQRRILGKVLTH